MLNHDQSTPLHKQLSEVLRQQIEAEGFKPDHPIPSERALCKTYQISRITVRQAISEMINEGLLFRKQGKGTFVAPKKINQGLVRLVSFSRTVQDLGMKPSTRILGNEILPADMQTAKILEIPITSQVLRLSLLGIADKEPLVFYESFFPLPLGKKMAEEANRAAQKASPFSTYDLYGKFGKGYPIEVRQTLEAMAADDRLASVMEIRKGEAVFMITSIFLSKGRRPLEFRRAMYRGTRYKFYITREIS
jgi:GntR family transcriptional regulator